MFRFAGALLLLLAALAAGCGGGDDGDSEATTEWADGVCSALSDWGTSMRSVTSGASPSSADRLKTVATDVKDATEELADDLEALGRPGTDAGEKAQDAIEELAAGLRQDLEKIQDAADSDDVVTAATTITSTLSSMSSRMGSTLTELEQADAKGELSDAFEESDACQKLANSSS
jgi:hypothetical protein